MEKRVRGDEGSAVQMFLDCFRDYAVVTGRASRWQYVSFVFVNSGVLLVLYSVDIWLGALYVLATFVPSIAVQVRRLQDTGRNGRWIYLALIPGIGAVVLLVLLLSSSQVGPNRFGPNPTEIDT